MINLVKLFFAGMLTLGYPAHAADSVDSGCRTLLDNPPQDTQANRAELITDHASLPAFCEVEGVIADRLRFILRLPVENWNGKFVVAGCGGFCGSLQPEKPGHSNSINAAVKRGYAAIQTDGGHEAQSWETDWAIGDPRALELYGGEWMPLAVDTGRELASRFYSRSPRRTYFSGCSNGGRLGMYAAQRYPTLFDGIAAGGGIFDLTGNSGVHGLWLLQTTRDGKGRAVISQAKLPQLAAAVVQQCDGLDGVEDGLIARPDRCSVDLSELDCEVNAKPGCFSHEEITAIERLYRGANVDGRQLFPGIPPGSEVLWDRWIVGTDEERAWGERAAEGNLRLTYGIPASEPFNPHDYVLADELKNLQRWAPVLNATDPDLSGLSAAGGKLFYYHGLADPLILVGRAKQYHREAVELMGRERLDAVARFVLVPGHGHCWEKPGRVADAFDPLEIIDRWVENGEAPDSIVADYIGDGPPRSRRLCALPRRAEYISGDSADADNFRCR